ncbi:MAG: MBL fold metallo-hydrolase [Legionellales bacterium]|nr:MBL fold metallo-hydrolase [Legionellales bacterium]
MMIKYFFDKGTSTFTYVVSDPDTNKCAIIDPVLDYDIYSGRTSTTSVDIVIDFVKSNNFTVEWILETHAHADHITGSQYLKDKLGGNVGIGEHIKEVQKFWVTLFNISNDTNTDGSQFDHLFKDKEIFNIGNIEVKVMYTPGHTPACLSYLIKDTIFVGDTIFMPYVGTARTDFPGGSAETLYQSIQKILSLPDSTKIYTCHDYPPSGQEPQCLSTVAEQKEKNIMVHTGISKEIFIKTRNGKDSGKEVPQLLLPSIQVNIRAGNFGMAENNNTKYIKIPIDKL